MASVRSSWRLPLRKHKWRLKDLHRPAKYRSQLFPGVRPFPNARVRARSLPATCLFSILAPIMLAHNGQYLFNPTRLDFNPPEPISILYSASFVPTKQGCQSLPDLSSKTNQVRQQETCMFVLLEVRAECITNEAEPLLDAGSLQILQRIDDLEKPYAIPAPASTKE
jgi:hypothetical protein